MGGMQVVVTALRRHGNVDVDDLRAQAEKHTDRLAALMITYPSTHGVFEEARRRASARSSTSTAARSTSTAPT